jgi:hypothetical protein
MRMAMDYLKTLLGVGAACRLIISCKMANDRSSNLAEARHQASGEPTGECNVALSHGRDTRVHDVAILHIHLAVVVDIRLAHQLRRLLPRHACDRAEHEPHLIERDPLDVERGGGADAAEDGHRDERALQLAHDPSRRRAARQPDRALARVVCNGGHVELYVDSCRADGRFGLEIELGGRGGTHEQHGK